MRTIFGFMDFFRVEPSLAPAVKQFDLCFLFHEQKPQYTVNHAYNISARQKLIQCLHQYAYGSPMHKWIAIINDGYFYIWWNPTADAVHKFLPASNSEVMEHVNKTNLCIPSPKRVPNSPKLVFKCQHQSQKQRKSKHIFSWTESADVTTGTIYTDLTGSSQLFHWTACSMSLLNMISNNNYTCIQINLHVPLEKASDQNSMCWTMRHPKQSNIVSTINSAKWQFLPSNDHGVNAAERYNKS